MESTVTLNLNDYPLVRDIGYGKSTAIWTHPDRQVDFDVFLYIESGAFEVWEAGREYIIKEGETFFLKNGLHHWGEPKTPPGTSWYWIHFYSRPYEINQQSLNYNSQEQAARNLTPEDFERVAVLPKQMKLATPKIVVEKLERLYNIYQSEGVYRPFRLGLLTLDLFLDLHKQESTEKKSSKSDVVVQKVIENIEKLQVGDRCVKDIAKVLNMNYSYISSIFKKKTGMSISEYGTRLKVFEAAKMLRGTYLNISEVSDRSGFHSPYYFSRVFKKIMGISPSEYLKQTYKV